MNLIRFDKVLRDKAFNIAKNPKYDGYQRGLASMVYKFLDKKPKGGGVNIEVKHNEQLAKELHKPVIRNFKKRTVYSGYKIFLKDKNGVSIVDASQKILDDSNRKPYKIWVDKGSEFYNNSFKKWLKNNNTEMHSIHNEGKSVVAARFIRTSKAKIYKYMTSLLKNVYIDKLDDIVGEYNNTYHRTI